MEEISIHDIFEILKKRIKLIIFCTLIATTVAAVFSFLIIKPKYESTVSFIIDKNASAGQGDVLNSNDVQMFQKLVKTYVELGKSNSIAEKVAKRLGDDHTGKEILGMITITPHNDTQILKLTAVSTDPKEAYEVVEKYSEVYSEEVDKMLTAGKLSVYDGALLPENPISPNKPMNLIIGFMLGMMIGIAGAFILAFMDRTIKTEDDIARHLDLPVIGIVPIMEEEKNARRS